MSDSATPAKNTLSVRVVIEAVAVTAIIWLGTTVNQSTLAIARMQVQLTQMQLGLADVPSLMREISEIKVTQAEHDRRILQIEQRRGP